MRKVYLFMFSVLLMISCDTFSGISAKYKYENMTISIEQIYWILNFKMHLQRI